MPKLTNLLFEYFQSWIKRRIRNRPGFQKVMINAMWLVADNLFRMFIGLVAGIWVARYLGPTNFGELNFALALVGMFSVVASLGIDNNVVRDLVSEPKHQSEILGTVFLMKLIVAIFAIFFCVGAVRLFRSDSPQTVRLIAILSCGMLFNAIETISLPFQIRLHSKYIVVAKNIVYTFGALIRIGLVLNNAPLIAFAWVVIIESAFAAIALLVVHYRTEGSLPTTWSFKLSRARAMLRSGWPLFFATISSMLYLRLDVIMLGQICGDEAVGIYGVVTRLSEVWYFLPMAIVASLQPGLVKAREQGREQFRARLIQIYVLMSSLSLIVSMLTMLLADPLVSLLYGAQYRESGAILAIHVWASVPVFLGVASSQFLIIENLQKISLYRTTIGLVSNALLNLLLMPAFGAKGAAFSTLVSYSIATFSIILFPQARAQVGLMLRSLRPDNWFRLAVNGELIN